jgi:hypothetical protein
MVRFFLSQPARPAGHSRLIPGGRAEIDEAPRTIPRADLRPPAVRGTELDRFTNADVGEVPRPVGD